MDNATLQRQRNDLFRKCADECTTNAQLCAETGLARCAVLCIECAATCIRAVAEGNSNPAVFERCADACYTCASACEQQLNAHCSYCASICRDCADTCLRWLCKIEIFDYRKQPVFM